MSEELIDTFPEDKTQEESFVFKLASLNDRFAAFVLDSIILGYLIWIWSGTLTLFFKGELRPLPHFHGFQQVLFLSTSLSFIFLYHLLFEGIFAATPGKLLVGIRVLHSEGRAASLFSIILRNLIRFIDLLGFPIFLIALIEGTRNRQRLGDILSQTIVVRQKSDKPIEEERRYASTLRRTLCFVIDLLLFIGWVGGYLLMIPVGQGPLNLLFLNLTPLVALLYLFTLNLLFEGTPGKLLLGLKLSQESGQRIGISGILTRSLFLPFDLNPVSYLCTLLSRKRQRPGDTAGRTVVIRTAYRWYYPLIFLVSLIVVSSLGTLGWHNPKNFLEKGYDINIAGRPFETEKLEPYLSQLDRIPFYKLTPLLEEIKGKIPSLPSIPFLKK
ncbi:MAG: RDD family protein [Deltaproteobacteria bacterium]|nr:RDD family protein [Deltaproteobacteria bacterium]